MSTIALHSPLDISEIVRDRGVVPNNHQYKEMATGNQTVKWPITSRDPESERSNSWPQYAYSAISRKQLELLFSNNRYIACCEAVQSAILATARLLVRHQTGTYTASSGPSIVTVPRGINTLFRLSSFYQCTAAIVSCLSDIVNWFGYQCHSNSLLAAW